MMIEMQLWHLISLLLSFFGFVFGTAKYLVSQIETRLRAIETGQKKADGEWTRIERELLTLKADLPIQYVRREDYVRGQSVIEAKLDAVYTKLDAIKEKKEKPHD